MTSLSEISIRRPVFAWMLMAAVVVFGILSFSRLGISQLPDVDFPVVSISLALNGAAPEVIEGQVLDTVEDSIMQIDGIRNVTSTAQQGSGTISVEFEISRNIDEAMQEIQNRINQVNNLLPKDLLPPVIRKSNPEDQPIMWISLTSDDPKSRKIDMMMYGRDFLYDQFSTLEGVGNIILGGYLAPTLRIWGDQKKLDYYNLTSDDVLQAIEKENIEIPSGRIEGQLKEYNVRTLGEATSPEEIGKIVVNNRINQGPNYIPTRLNQIATIEEGVADVRRISGYNGKPTIALGIVKQHGSNAVEVAKLIRKRLEELRPLIKSPYRVEVRSDNTRFISQSVDSLLFTLLMSAALTSVVCFLFLGSISSTFNVLLAIPTSIIGTFISFYFFGFTLNTFTLLGLSLAIGIVVDDAIMMLENIVRHREMRKKKKEAALAGAREITFPAVAATLAIVAIFLPVIFMDGIIGRYFLQYGLTVTVAVVLSLMEALTLTPMRCSRYLTIETEKKGFTLRVSHFFERLAHAYTNILRLSLVHKKKTVSIAAIFFIFSLLVAKYIPSEMMPAQDQSSFLLRYKLPVGSSIQVTDAKVKEVEDYLHGLPEVEGAFSIIGGFGGDAVNQGISFVTLVDRSKRKISQADLIKKVRVEIKDKIKGINTAVQDTSLRGFSASRGFPVEFVVQGSDWQKLTEFTKDIMDKMKSSGFLVDVNTDVQEGMPEVALIPNKKKLADHGVSLNSVTSVINAMVGGAILNGKTEYSKNGRRYAIEFRLQASERDQIPDLKKIKIRNNRGEAVALSELVDIREDTSLMLVSRLNRVRAITIYANPAPGVSQKNALKKTEEIAKSSLPKGYSYMMTGTSQSFNQSFRSLIIALILGIIVSYMVLASQFNSFIQPISVLMALPFSFSGAFIGLYLFHQSINIYSLIGFILLMGIVKKNSILLVDFTNKMREAGATTVDEALLKACPIRLRPILMTSFATIAGALPEALDLGPGAESTIPMSVAIIGGVMASTLLVLFVVPCAYSLLTRFEQVDEKIIL